MRIQNSADEITDIQVDSQETILQALQRAGASLWAPCGGNGTCGKCTVVIQSDEGTKTVLACQSEAKQEYTVVLGSVGEVAVETNAQSEEPVASDLQNLALAVDIGTTTCAFELIDRTTRQQLCTYGAMNPQAIFGADVIARISAAADPAAADRMSTLIRESIQYAAQHLCEKAGAELSAIKELVVVGNTTMEHLACGLDVQPMGRFPFTPQCLFGCEHPLYAPEGLPEQTAWLAPALAGYVGGDITAGILSTGMAERAGLTLFIDIGTNGEMALGNQDHITTCAVAAGPAFEGANITFGMPALPGAISEVALEQGEVPQLTIKTIDGDHPVGICGSGLLDAVACLLELGVVDETGYLMDDEDAEEDLGLDVSGFIADTDSGTVVYLDPDHRVFLSQGDIRKVQLAKGAVRAGIETLLQERGVGYQQVERVVLSGGFGMHLRAESACRIGMVPPALMSKISAGGNTALRGAVQCVFPEGRAAMQKILPLCSYLELSTQPTFNELYLEGMEFLEKSEFEEERG